MPTLALSPASAPTTAPSFSVSVLPLLRLALALVLNGLAFRGTCLAAGGEGRRLEEPETQRREKRARMTQPQTKCPHG